MPTPTLQVNIPGEEKFKFDTSKTQTVGTTKVDPAFAPPPAPASTSPAANVPSVSPTAPTPADELTRITKEAGAIQTQIDTLRAQETTTDTDEFVTSSDEVVQDEKTLFEEVTESLGTFDTTEADLRAASDAYINVLDDRSTELSKELKAREKLIKEQFKAAETELKGTQTKEKGFLGTTLSRIGGYLGASASGTGAMITLNETHRQEITNLSTARTNAVLAAREAASVEDFALSKAKAAQAKSIEQEIALRREEYTKEITALSEVIAENKKKAQEEENILKNQTLIVKGIQEGITDPFDLFESLGGAVSFDDIKEITDELAVEADDPFTLGSKDIRYDGSGNVVARGSAVGGGGTSLGGGTNVSGLLPGMTGYSQDILVTRIGKQVYGTRISDSESERIEGIIKAGMKEGKSELNIMDDVLGFTITNPNKEAFADGLRNVLLSIAGEGGLSKFDMLGLARLINAGNDAQAIQKVENEVYSDARILQDDLYMSEASVRYSDQKVDELQAMLDKMIGTEGERFGVDDPDELPIGVVTGTMQEWLGRFKNPEAMAILNDATFLVAEMRNRLSGTAVTETEAKFLEPIIPRLGDSPQNFFIKMNALKDDPLLRLNSLRSVYNLPSLDGNTVESSSARIDLYRKAGEQAAQNQIQGQTNNSFLGNFEGTQSEVSNEDFFGSFDKEE